MSQTEPPYAPTKEEIERFFKAIEGGDFKYVRETVEQHPEAVNWTYDTGFVPLQWSFMGNYKGGDYAAIPDYLLDHGANVNAMQPGPNGSPMVVCAIVDGSDELATRLVEKGADITWKSSPRTAPEGFPELEDLGGGTFLIYAAGWNSMKTAKALLDRGADVNERDNKGMTAIMNAASSAKMDMLEFLMARGASIHDQDANGKTVLMYAADGGNKDMIDRLTALGCTLGGQTAGGDDIRDVARKSYRKTSLPAIEDAFRRVTDEAVSAVTEGLDQPLTITVKPLRLKARRQFLRI